MVSNATVIISNGSTILNAFAFASSGGNSIYISQPGTYSIVSAYNNCGFGRGQGIVRVMAKPYLALSRLNRSDACVGQTVSFSYAAAGDYEATNKLAVYLVDNYAGSQSRTLVAENTLLSGVASLSLNPGLKPSSYSFQVESSAPKSTFNSAEFMVYAPVSATLASGARVVYAGDTQQLFIATNSFTGGLSYTVATPTGLTLINNTLPGFSLIIRPTQSGSYSLVSASNQCGLGRATGLFSFTTLPPADVTIRPVSFGGIFCTDQAYPIVLNTTGVFSTTNTFTAYLADSTGGTVRTLPTISSPTRLTVTIPPDLPPGDSYLLRVGSSGPVHLGASTPQQLSIRRTPTGTLTGNTSILKGDSTRLSVALTGTPPWQLVLTDFFGPRTFSTATTPFTLTVRPDTTSGYRLTDVRNNQCGTGTATGTALITVTRLLATDPALPLQVRTWPNPTATTLQIEGNVPGRADVQLTLHTLSGTLVQAAAGVVRQGRFSHQLDLSQLPTGVYLLTAEQEGRRSQFKVLKQ